MYISNLERVRWRRKIKLKLEKHKQTAAKTSDVLNARHLFVGIGGWKILQGVLELGEGSNWPVKTRHVQLVDRLAVRRRKRSYGSSVECALKR